MSLYSDVLTSGLYRPLKVQPIHSIAPKLPPHIHPLLLSLSGIYTPGQYFPALITLGPGTRQLRTAPYTPKFTKVIKTSNPKPAYLSFHRSHNRLAHTPYCHPTSASGLTLVLSPMALCGMARPFLFRTANTFPVATCLLICRLYHT